MDTVTFLPSFLLNILLDDRWRTVIIMMVGVPLTITYWYLVIKLFNMILVILKRRLGK